MSNLGRLLDAKVHAGRAYAYRKSNPGISRLAHQALEHGKDDASVLCGSGWALTFVVRDLGADTGLVDRALMLNSNLAEAWRCSAG